MPNPNLKLQENLIFPGTLSGSLDKSTLEKIINQINTATKNLNNQNDTLQKASVLFTMVNGQSEGLSLNSELAKRLDREISSNLTIKTRNEAAMSATLILGLPTSKEKSTYLATINAIDDKIKTLNEKNNENKLTSRHGDQMKNATVNSTTFRRK